MKSVQQVLVALARRFAFRELAYLVGGGAADDVLTSKETACVQQLCAYGQRMLDLDMEELENPDAVTAGSTTDTSRLVLEPDAHVPQHLIERGMRSRALQSPMETPRAALATTHPAARLVLEVIAARWQRLETNELIGAIHLASEYVPLLAWQTVLGHGADPAELQSDQAFRGPGSRWGHFDEPKCSHTKPQRAAASRALRVADEPPSGWQSYMQRQHSVVSQALGVCAAACKTPCAVMTSHPPQDQARVTEACRAAAALAASPIVQIRHSAPVGHGFGGPSPAQISAAWQRSRAAIAKRGGLSSAVLIEDGYPLTGLTSLISAVAGTRLTPDTLIADTAAEVVTILDPEGIFA